MTEMKFGVTPINFGPNSYPEKMASVAQAAEEAGFDSVWVGDHPFLSEKQKNMPPSLRILDPIAALGFVAGQTRKILLGTGILLLPQFNPVIVAKQLASLDVLSNGRLVVGIGVGWSEHEFDVLGLPFGDRGKRADDYLKAIEVLWSEDRPAYRGQYVSFDKLQSYPHVVQRPHPPIVVGGSTPPAFRRAVESGNGWFGYGMDLKETKRCVEGLRKASRRYSRPKALGELEISVAPSEPVDRAAARQFSELGVDRLILILPEKGDLAAMKHFVKEAGRTLVGQI